MKGEKIQEVGDKRMRQGQGKGVRFQSGGMSADNVWTDSSQQKKHCPVTCGNDRWAQSGEIKGMEMWKDKMRAMHHK